MSGWSVSATETSAVRDFAQRLDIFFSAATESLCRVHARLEQPEGPGDFQLSGTLSGPHCKYADTLPATYAFTNRGAPSWVSAEALVPEPCFWTPQMPQLYDAEIELREGGRVVAQAKRIFGIRRLGTGRHTLIFDGKPWVLRGVVADELLHTELADWNDAQMAMCVRNPNDALCDAASREGVLLVAELGQADVGEIVRLRRWPSVGIIAVTAPRDADLRGLPQNAVLACRLPAREALQPTPWADALAVDVNPAEPLEGLVRSVLPVLVIRREGRVESIGAGRRRCDRLQRDLAPLGQFAGYIV